MTATKSKTEATKKKPPLVSPVTNETLKSTTPDATTKETTSAKKKAEPELMKKTEKRKYDQRCRKKEKQIKRQTMGQECYVHEDK